MLDPEKIADQPYVGGERRSEFGETCSNLSHSQIRLIVRRNIEVGRAQKLQNGLEGSCSAVSLSASLEHRN